MARVHLAKDKGPAQPKSFWESFWVRHSGSKLLPSNQFYLCAYEYAPACSEQVSSLLCVCLCVGRVCSVFFSFKKKAAVHSASLHLVLAWHISSGLSPFFIRLWINHQSQHCFVCRPTGPSGRLSLNHLLSRTTRPWRHQFDLLWMSTRPTTSHHRLESEVEIRGSLFIIKWLQQYIKRTVPYVPPLPILSVIQCLLWHVPLWVLY